MCTQKIALIAAGNNHAKLYSHAAPDELKQPGMSIFQAKGCNKMGVVLTKQLYKFPRLPNTFVRSSLDMDPKKTYPKCHKPQLGILKN